MEISKNLSTDTTGQSVESDDVLYIEISAKTGQYVKEVCLSIYILSYICNDINLYIYIHMCVGVSPIMIPLALPCS